MQDARVQAAIDAWAPRLMAQGVDYNDFVRAAAEIMRWDEWLDVWCDMAHIHARLGVGAEVHGRARTAGEAYARAAVCYHFARFVWLLDRERERGAAQRASECMYAAYRLLDPSAERIEAPYEKSTLVGNLRRPAGVERPPLVLIVPGLDSAKEEFFQLEQICLARGLATLTMDGPGQGELIETSSLRPDYEVAAAALLGALEGRDNLDLARVGVLGMSLGGYSAVRVAAFNPQIGAVAAVSAPYNLGECWGGLPQMMREVFIARTGARDETEARRLAYDFDLEDALVRLKQPLLVVFGKLDRYIPAEQAERIVSEAAHADLVMYSEGNHGCDTVPFICRPLLADWLRERLLAL